MRLGIATGEIPGRLRSAETGDGNVPSVVTIVERESPALAKKFRFPFCRLKFDGVRRVPMEGKIMTVWPIYVLSGFIVTE